MIPIPLSRSSEISPNTSWRDCGIQARAGLVQEQHFRVADKGSGEGEPLLLAAGEPADTGPAESVNAEALHEFIHRLGIAVHPGDVAEERQGTGRRREAAFLEHHAYAGTQVSAGVAGILSEQGNGSAGALLQSLGAFDGGGLAGAVGSEQRSDLAASCDQ